ncbi:MAG: MFS transporter [Acidimicrobiia bacterium]
MSEAPFIPDAAAGPELPPGQVLRNKPFLRLFSAQVASSLGDWIGILAILAIATELSDSGVAVSLVMTARMVPGFFLAPLGGVLVDKLDRRRVMVITDLGRAAIFAVLPFTTALWQLVLASLVLEILTLLWAPAKDASVPNLVGPSQLPAANSLGMVAAYGTFPISGLVFASLAGIAAALSKVGMLDWIPVSQVALALWFDGLTFVVSALLILRLPLGRAAGTAGDTKIDFTQTWREMVDGLRFMTSHRLVRGVIVGLGAGLIGGGALVPLGPVFARELLKGGAAIFSILMVALGTGAALGVVAFLWLQRWIQPTRVFPWGVVGSGAAIALTASFSGAAPAALSVALVGACAGTAYVTGFSILQSRVSDELRGRTFGALYTVVRVCLLLSMTVSPLFADLYGWMVDQFVSKGAVTVAGADYSLPGVRVALWAGGFVAVVAGLYARREIKAELATVTL